MIPLEEFPEVPEGLEEEVYYLFEQTPKEYPSFSEYFKRNSNLDKRTADLLDGFVNQLYGTYEALKQFESCGAHEPKYEVEFNAFATAAMGTLNFTGLVEGAVRDADEGVRELTQSLSAKLNQGLNALRVIAGVNEGQQYAGMPKPAATERDFNEGIAALKGKLRFEAGLYAKMKEHYRVTVELPA